MKGFLCIISCLVWLTPTLAISASIRVKLALPHPAPLPISHGAVLFKEIVSDQLKDKVEIEVISKEQFRVTSQILKELESNRIQMAPIPLSQLLRFATQLEIFELPFLFEDQGAVTRFQNSPYGRKLLDSAKKRGFKGLAFWHLGMKQFLADKYLSTPMDAKGLRFVVPDPYASEAKNRFYNSIGAARVSIPFTDIYSALQRGKIDGLEGTWAAISNWKLPEKRLYVSVTNHAYAGFLLTANSGFWEMLTSDVRARLNTVVSGITKVVNRLSTEKTNQAIEAISKYGLFEIRPLTREGRAKWIQAMIPVWKMYEKEIGKNIIQAASRSGTGGGGDPCRLGTCRCPNRDCEKECCY